MGYTLCVLGCGTMGVAITSGVLASLESQSPLHGLSSGLPKWESHTPGTSTPINVADDDPSLPSRFVACVKREESARLLREKFRTILGGDAIQVLVGQNVSAVQRSDVVLLCCKPQVTHPILSEDGIKEALAGKLLISIVTGVTIAQLSSWVLPSTTVVRAMPNVACRIREGMTVVSTLSPSNAEGLHKLILLQLFSSIGRCRFLDERQFDASTALSGCGPAFACIFLEAMADGGVMMGLPRAEALELAAQSLQGAARMALQPGSHPAQIKDSVATPGGCTIAGLLALEDGRVRSTIARAIQVATERAGELGQSAPK
ncbi:pyrroline-5-carboxylate reductase [Russula earlei]|uniref:Pyrroline-5-carboxylate reductase n=1 Tax=Russula earlei TaxID=71964 RepID=A0ACC0UF29_9AGAM|nr:pyrroline-5-carboxylate reductase [Russula earlei]